MLQPVTLGPRATKAQGFLQGAETAERTGMGKSGTVRNDTFGKSKTGLLSALSSILGHPALPRAVTNPSLHSPASNSILKYNFVFYSRKTAFF